MSSYAKPQRGIKEQNLAADRDGQLSGTLSSYRFPTKVALVSLLAHGCLVLAFVLADPAVNLAGQSREIPVAVVIEPPPEQRPAAPGTGKKFAAPKEPAQAQSREPQQRPEVKANPRSANAAMSGPNPVAKPAAPQPSAMTGPGARPTPARKAIVHKETTPERRLAARLAGGPRQDGGGEHRWPTQTGLALAFYSGPESFRAVAVPLPAEGGGEAMSYRVIVGGMLERAKHYPEAAVRRGAKGGATIGFILDESGRVASVSLLRSSGEADLDAESMALVKRAAPFPPPPPGAKRSFAIEVAFGMGS